MQMIVGHPVEDHTERRPAAVSGISDRARQESERRMVGAKPAAPSRESGMVVGLREAA